MKPLTNLFIKQFEEKIGFEAQKAAKNCKKKRIFQVCTSFFPQSHRAWI
jgi:hypothetical protein